MRFLSALRRACPISVQQQQQCQQQRVNALWRAYLISTARKERGISHEHAVSMPYIRLLPFLQMAETKTSIRQIVCQCPTSGFSHFYLAAVAGMHILENVSMPYIGLLPFLPRRPTKLLIVHNGVNALHRASPISTENGSENDDGNGCVNALHRASPISTSRGKRKIG